MSLTKIVIDSRLSAAQFKSVVPLAQGGVSAMGRLAQYFRAIMGGLQSADVAVEVGAVQAVATVTISSTGPTNNQVITLCGQAITAKTNSAVPANGEYNISATPATVATGIAAAVNAVVALQGICSAVAVDAVVTITAKDPGTMGNGLKLVNTTPATNTVVVTFAGGSAGTAYALGNE